MQQIEKYALFELTMPGAGTEVPTAVFAHADRKIDVFGLYYLGIGCNCIYNLHLPATGSYRVELLDTMETKRWEAVPGVCGDVRVGLPGKEGMAILVTRLSGEPLA